ncbi:P-loop containing nucleoside triphosphate hydrolase protein, partial [Rhizophagus irregularis DAOM 181602=DAOM 197198]
LEYQEKVFQEIESKMLKILLITPEKLMLNQGFRNMLRKVHGEIGVRFVIDEAHCILEYNHYRPEWRKLGCLKEFFPSTSILLLTATCSQDDAEVIRQNLNINSVNFNVIRSSCFSRPEIEYIVKKKSTSERNLVEIAKIVNEISDGQCIIYCSSPGICNEILPLLQDKLKGTAIGTYHGGLESFERDQVMLQWKSRLLKVMIATNAFGLGVNSPNIRTVVHYTFPSSISNFIQESGRAGRDGNPAQSILFYSRNDIKTVYTIITGGRESDFDNNESTSLERTQYLNKGQRKIFEMVTYCESIYECRAQQLAAYHSWQSDSKIPRCTKCDCCINYFKDLPKSENIKNDVIHLLKVIIAVTEFLGMRNQLTLPIDIIHVFAKANNNNIKEKQLSSLPIYKQDYNKTLRRFEDISRLLDNLIIKNLVKVRIDLKKVNTSTSSTQLSGKVIIEGITENAIEIAQNRCWSFLLK